MTEGREARVGASHHQIFLNEELVRLKVLRGVLCLGVAFLSQASRIAAQDATPPQTAPQTAPQTPPATQQPTQQTTAPDAAAPPPPIIQDRETGGDNISIEPIYWITKKPPILRIGKLLQDTQTVSGNLDFPGGSNHGIGAVVTFPTGRQNSLQLSYWQVKGSGTTTNPTDLTVFAHSYLKGDLLDTTYRIQNFKVSWNYLTYPFPSNHNKFRLKTLWELQYLKARSTIDAPLDFNTSQAIGPKSIFRPTIGLGIEYHPSSHVRIELKGSGFGWPHGADIWDTEGNIVVRASRIEILVGGRAYHYKTGPKDDQYYTQTMWGPAFGVRWILR
jgi:hypothetical protein